MLITLTLSMSKMNGTLLPEAGAPKLASPTSQLHYSGFPSLSLSLHLFHSSISSFPRPAFFSPLIQHYPLISPACSPTSNIMDIF